jgi:hypothetical protein
MAYFIQAGIQVSINYNPSTGSGTWHKLTDHNRDAISISQELIETQERMANGTMRKYVISQKDTISVSWSYVPSRTSETADLNNGAAWIESFYRANVRTPVYLKVVSSEIDPDTALGAIPNESGNNFKTSADEVISIARPNATGSKIYTVFMTNFSKTVINRTKLSDYVDMSIDFTEI